MSLIDWSKIEARVSCDRCTQVSCDCCTRPSCLGPCPDCGAYNDHGEACAYDCTIEETMKMWDEVVL